MATNETQCLNCKIQENTYKCQGCSKYFCFNHLIEHRQTLNQQFGKIEDDRNKLIEKFIEQKNNPNKRPLIQEINRWEEESINKIKQKAEKFRQILIQYTNKYFIQLENKLTQLTEDLKENRREGEFNEKHVNDFGEKLIKLQEEIVKPTNFSVRQNSDSFFKKISVTIPSDLHTKWKQYGTTVAGGNGEGDKLNQLYCPSWIFIDDNQSIYVADWFNNRIVEWRSNANNGRIVAGGNGKGNNINQLNRPNDVIIDKQNNSIIISDQDNRRVIRWSCQNNTNGEILISDIDCRGLAMDMNGCLYVCDREKHEVKRWKIGDKDGTIVAGGNGKGNKLNQLDCPTFIYIDNDSSLYVSDQNNNRMIKWIKDAKEGIIVAGGNGRGNSLSQLDCPLGVIVDHFSQIYVADCGNNRIMRWIEGAKEGTIIVGGRGIGEQANQLNSPFNLSFDRDGNLYVADCGNHRIQRFEIDEN